LSKGATTSVAGSHVQLRGNGIPGGIPIKREGLLMGYFEKNT